MEQKVVDQIIAAKSIARAHGHGWAVDFEDSEVESMVANAADIDDFVATLSAAYAAQPRLQNGNTVYGIDSPYFNGDGVIQMSTGTGRLTWSIDQECNVRIICTRPYQYRRASGEQVEEIIVVAEVTANPQRFWETKVSYIDKRQFCRKHFDAIQRVLRAIGCTLHYETGLSASLNELAERQFVEDE